MCGESPQGKLADAQTDFYKQAQAEANTAFQEQQGMIAQFQSIYDPILAAGPNQKGFSAAEEENLNAQTVEGTAENYAGALKALNKNLAAEGGGNIDLTSGQQTQLRAELAASSAGEQSKEETQVQEQDYAAGREEFNQASSALAQVSNELSPTGYMNAATGAGNAAESTLSSIAQEQESWRSAALGAVGSMASNIFQ